MRNPEQLTTISEFKKTWAHERPDLDPAAVATDLRMQLVARYFADSSSTALSDFDLEWCEYDMLSALRRVGSPYKCTVSSLNDILPLTSGALTHRLNLLVGRKLVTRQNDEADRRRVLVKLTPKGLRLVETAATARFQAAQSVVDILSGSEKKSLDLLLDKLIRGQN